MGAWEGPYDVEVWRIRAGALQAELDASRDRVSQLEAALRDARTELAQWGWGDMHYISAGRQEKRVVDALAAIDAALVDEGTEGTPA